MCSFIKIFFLVWSSKKLLIIFKRTLVGRASLVDNEKISSGWMIFDYADRIYQNVTTTTIITIFYSKCEWHLNWILAHWPMTISFLRPRFQQINKIFHIFFAFVVCCWFAYIKSEEILRFSVSNKNVNQVDKAL